MHVTPEISMYFQYQPGVMKIGGEVSEGNKYTCYKIWVEIDLITLPNSFLNGYPSMFYTQTFLIST